MGTLLLPLSPTPSTKAGQLQAGRKAMIDRKHRLSVTRQAQLLGLSRGAVYYLPQPVGAADLALMRRLDALHLEHPFMGARRLRRQLQSGGLQVGRRHVRTRSYCAWAWRRYVLSPVPASAIRTTRSMPICCAI